MRVKLFALSLTLLALPTLVSAAPTSKPQLKQKVKQKVDTKAYWSAQVLSPLFRLNGPKEEIAAGSAYLAVHPRTGANILCSALHLLGPAGGMKQQLSLSEANKRVQNVFALNSNGSIKVIATGLATKNGYASKEDEEFNATYDFIAYNVNKRTSATPFRFAKSNPRIGETVWVLGPISYSARVAAYKPDGLYLETSGNPQFRGYSGGPIINARGEVVASLVGSTGSYVIACSVGTIQSLLR
jgi:hypothetical protein